MCKNVSMFVSILLEFKVLNSLLNYKYTYNILISVLFSTRRDTVVLAEI